MMLLAEASNTKVAYLSREEEYKEYFSTAASGIIYLDSLGRIRNINPEAERICGVERIKVLGRRADIVFRDYGAKFTKIFETPEVDDSFTGHVTVRIRDQMSYLDVTTIKMLNTIGEVAGLIVIMQDVSAVRAAIKQIQTTQMLMSLGELAAGVAHHVRTPLTTISGYLQVMVNRLEDDKYTVRRDVLETLLGEVSYINEVVKELVLFAKPPVDKKNDICINSTIEDSLRLTFRDLGGEKVEIAKELAPSIPTINADSNLLKQAIVNVLQNAMEAMSSGGTLTIKSWLNSDLNMIVIAITDTGSGVPPELLSKVFEPFYTSKLDRMGLGLPIAHRIISEHGGFINIGHGEPCGTKVHIYLPVIERTTHFRVVHQQALNLQ